MTFGYSKPLLNFSASENRATLLTEDSVPDQEITKHTPKKKPRKGTKTRGSRGIRIVKGQVAFRVPGYTGVQKFAATQLVKFVPIGKLKTAAKRILKTSKRRPANQQQV
jgi:hypothetical protein